MKRPPRNAKVLIAAATAVLVLAGSAVGYRWVTSSRHA